MDSKIFFITACTFFLIIDIPFIIQAFAQGLFIHRESISFNFENVTGIAVRILGSILISFYFLKFYLKVGRQSGEFKILPVFLLK